MKFLIGHICGLATAIWILRKQLFTICDYPDLDEVNAEDLNKNDPLRCARLNDLILRSAKASKK
jgi:hypothetical protein